MAWWEIAIACLAGFFTTCLLTLRRSYLVVRVSGLSMMPSLRPGDRVLVRRADPARLRTGMIVVLRAWPGSRSPGASEWLIKRLAAGPGDTVPEIAREGCGNASVVPDGMAVVLSDNKGGGDSRTWGFASCRQVAGYMISLLPGNEGC
jgi:signal peptidase I